MYHKIIYLSSAAMTGGALVDTSKATELALQNQLDQVI
jgi:hypothetical protein